MFLINELERLLAMCYTVYNEYKWLLNAYVSDFYVSNHWDSLPECWKESLENLTPCLLADIIDITRPVQTFQVLPLSLLSLRQSMKSLSLPRQQNTNSSKHCPSILFNENILAIERIKNSFWRRIKLKKKHEIELIAEMCCKIAKETRCYNVVDVGSGLGHLSRILCYKYGLRVCALEAQQYLSAEASKLDNAVESSLRNYFNMCFNESFRVKHLNIKVKTNSNGEDILEVVKTAFQVDNVQFGIIGLHPCGDLGPTLLRLFSRCPQVKFINIVGCCYMKLSSLGYPLSTYTTLNKYDLDYSAREVACHAIEAYISKLKAGQYEQLKVHAYRAVLEKLIVKKSPNLRHSQVRSVKFSKNLSFAEYCTKALWNFDIPLSESEILTEEVEADLDKWKNVVIFYSLRLMMAPLVENMITFDRMLYVLQSGHRYKLKPIFDPEVSPRNQVFTAIK